jgi:hypothetical protein
MPIPALNSHGVLPPHQGNPADRVSTSPYQATTLELCVKFSKTPARRAILKGYLGLRTLLHHLQITNGFQWVDGTFLEDGRHPKQKSPDHIQVVTFCHPSPLFAEPEFSDLVETLTSRKATRTQFQVDHMPVLLSWPTETVIDHTRHWCGLLSHQRETGVWKGLLRIDLNTIADDTAALQHLASLESQ